MADVSGGSEKAFFLFIDPEQKDGQGNDIGEQYETGIYYNKEDCAQLMKIMAEEKNIRFSIQN